MSHERRENRGHSRCVRMLRRALHPSVKLLLPLTLLSILALAIVFVSGNDRHPLAYAVYLLSTYALSAAIAALPPLFRRVRSTLDRNPMLHRLMTDADFRANASLLLVLMLNLAFCVLKGALALILRSAWLGAVALYYLVLSFARYLLLRYVRSGEGDPLAAFRRYRFCGFLLLTLTLTVQVLAFHAIYLGEHPRYPGVAIYAAAAYCFMSLSLATVNYARYRRRGNPIYEAHRSLSLATALISLFSLQTALIAGFGTAGSAFQKRMDAATAGAVLLIIALMSLRMILRGNRAVSALKRGQAFPSDAALRFRSLPRS